MMVAIQVIAILRRVEFDEVERVVLLKVMALIA
jgi:hypothetical protein